MGLNLQDKMHLYWSILTLKAANQIDFSIKYLLLNPKRTLD